MKLGAAAAAALACMLAAAPSRAENGLKPSDAFVEGMAAYRMGDSLRALPLLDHAAQGGYFLAQYRLATIYANPRDGHLNELAAFRLYEGIAELNREIDPYVDPRAPYVARAYLAVGRYWRNCIADGSIEPDLARARDYFEYAASYFDNADAQFELAKLDLAGSSDDSAVSTAMHWLMTLAEKRNHVGAQAYLGDLFSAGEQVPRRPALGLALITIALTGADPSDRIWVEDLYQRVLCRASPSVRTRADEIVSTWRATRNLDAAGDQSEPIGTLDADLNGLAPLGSATRTCANGEVIVLPGRSLLAPDAGADIAEVPPVEPEIYAETKEATPAGSEAEGTFSGAMGLGLTGEAGVPEPPQD